MDKKNSFDNNSSIKANILVVDDEQVMRELLDVYIREMNFTAIKAHDGIEALEAIEKNKPELYLLCYYDLEWKFDLLRENGSDERRTYLFERYRQEIEKIACDYQIIKGFKQERFNLAIKAIENKVKLKC